MVAGLTSGDTIRYDTIRLHHDTIAAASRACIEVLHVVERHSLTPSRVDSCCLEFVMKCCEFLRRVFSTNGPSFLPSFRAAPLQTDLCSNPPPILFRWRRSRAACCRPTRWRSTRSAGGDYYLSSRPSATSSARASSSCARTATASSARGWWPRRRARGA